MRIACIAIVFFHISSVFADQNEFTNKVNKYTKNISIKIRQSTFDLNAIEKPASLQFIHPGDGNKNNSYSINSGISAVLNIKDKWQIGPTIEYHRQTEISKPQNNLQFGLTCIYLTGDVTNSYPLFFQTSLKYKRDPIAKTKGLIADFDITPLMPRFGMGSDIGFEEFQFLWQPNLGLLYEMSSEVFDVKNGKVFGFVGNIESALYPFAGLFKRRFELVARYTYWLNLKRNGSFAATYKKEHNLLQLVNTFYFDDAKHFGIALEYLDGDNPEQGLFKQKVTTVSLKIMF